MKNKYFNLFMLFISIVGITFAISSIVKSYFAEAINIQHLVRNISIILFFLGVIFFYIFYKNRKLLYLGYLFLFVTMCVQMVLIIISKSLYIILVPCIIGSIYVFCQINKYLYKINDKIFLLTISKIIYIGKRYRYNLAWLYYNEGNYEKSIKILKNCVTLDEFYLLANNYEQINEYEKAIELYTKILLNDAGERPEILYNRGEKYKKLGMYDEAIKDFISCINCNKPDTKAYIALGVIKDELGKYEEAREYFNKGKSLDDSFDEYIPEKYK